MREKIRENEKIFLIIIFALAVVVMGVLCLFRANMRFTQKPRGTYEELAPDTSRDNPLAFIGEDFQVMDGFHSNLPLVVVSLEEDIPEYKVFLEGKEVIYEDVEPYTTGKIKVIDTKTGGNTLTDAPSYESIIKIKVKGHSSIQYDKQQYKIKALNPDGTDNETSILGMGEGSEWIINGSMADKSMLRNYLGYRIASEIGGNNMAPDSRFCEVVFDKDGKLTYQGVFLLMETVSRGDERVKVDSYDPTKSYSSYIVRRDRKTSFDIMLDTYGRTELFKDDDDFAAAEDNWIGIKYPSQKKITDDTIKYITRDFSRIEKVLYSDKDNVYSAYDKYINVDTFVDYFLINEFFGNYDAGEHSTYMYKNSGDRLNIGPVWDFDQAMNNSFEAEYNAEEIAFQERTFFKQLCNDKNFVKKLKKRYTALRQTFLSEDHVFSMIDETVAYLKSAQVR